MPARSNVGRWLVGALTLVGWGMAATGPGRSDAVHVVLLHTNELSGQSQTLDTLWVRHLPLAIRMIRLAERIDSERAAEPGAFVVDAGNWFRGTPGGTLEQDLGHARGLAKLGLDAACVGNHEFGPGLAHLSRMLVETGLPAVVANVRDPATGTGLRGTMPWRMVERGGVRLAFVGLCAMVTPALADANELTFEPPVVAWDRACREIGGQADLIVPLTYLPLAEARELARARPEIPLIIAVHDHTRLERGVREGRTLIVESGASGVSLGRVDLWLAKDSKKVLRSEVRRIEFIDEPDNSLEGPVAAACR